MSNIKLYCIYLKKIFRSRVMYIKDFILSLLLNVVSNTYSIIFIGIVFSNIPSIEGWNLYEMLLIYGINSICRGIFCTFFGELDLLSDEYILNGKLDAIMLRPRSTLLLLVSQNIYEENLSNILIGTVCLIYSFKGIQSLFTIKTMVILILSIVFGSIIYFSFFVIICSLAFWFNTRFSLMWSFLDVTEYANYPATIFHKSIRRIITWFIPFGLVSFYPSIIMLGKCRSLNWIGYLIPIITIIWCIIAAIIWKRGLDRYESIN